jgi:hypothetical protein
MTTRKLIACALLMTVALTGCAYTSTTDADQESMGFDATAVHAECSISENCPHNPAECPMSEEACSSMQKTECSSEKMMECAKEKKAECDEAMTECEEAKASECEDEKPCCDEDSTEG